MLHARHRALQLGVLVAGLVAPIQLTLDRVNFPLLIGERFAALMDEDWNSVLVLLLRDLAVEIEPALL